MRVLWLCNFMLPVVAEHLGLEATNKEGWLSGLLSAILQRGQNNDIELAVAFPVSKEQDGYQEVLKLPLENARETLNSRMEGKHGAQYASLHVYGFYEDTMHPEDYDVSLEARLKRITDDFVPDVVHIYGTEYPHTLAMCQAFENKNRILIGIQGLVSVYANAFFANMDEKTIKSVTFRDLVKGDSLRKQQQKYEMRGQYEILAVKLAGHVTGRTAWDKHYTEKWNPLAAYHHMNETLRSNFYDAETVWDYEKCEKHSLFLSQGNYPIKGLHYMLLALPGILKKYPDAKVYVAGDSIIKSPIKISAYGRYLRNIIKREHLEDKVVFLGSLNAMQMKERYVKSHTFVCPSSIENSPNSLGEAMILGVPCISAKMGGVESIFRGQEDGILYPGFATSKNSFDNTCDENAGGNEQLENIVKSLQKAVLDMWSDEDKMMAYSRNARSHAKITHDREINYQKMTEIYAKIAKDSKN